MNVAQASTTRDLPVSAPAQNVAPAAPAPVSGAGARDTFGPATRVAISSTLDTPPAAAARARSDVETVEKVIAIDDATKSLVYKDLNEVTGAVVSQYPDEAKLRLRAYFDEISQQQTQAATAGTHLDPSTIDGIRV